MIVTIDGPAGSGKSSTAKEVANNLGWNYLDSGSLYRAVTWLFVHEYDYNIEMLIENLTTHNIKIEPLNNKVDTILDGNTCGSEIREQVITNNVSKVAENGVVRQFVNKAMYKAVQEANFVADGRDLGTAVFPDAFLKFFMIADVEIRAKRRYKEMTDNGLEADFEEIKKNLQERDYIDSNREIAPLTKASDAIEIDTTGLSFAEQVETITKHIQSRLN